MQHRADYKDHWYFQPLEPPRTDTAVGGDPTFRPPDDATVWKFEPFTVLRVFPHFAKRALTVLTAAIRDPALSSEGHKKAMCSWAFTFVKEDTCKCISTFLSYAFILYYSYPSRRVR